MATGMTVTLLGTGSPVPGIERFGMSTLIEAGGTKLLIDCGRGALQRLRQLALPLGTVDKLFLTHLHSDHLVGLPDLWLSAWVAGRDTPLRVWGPQGTVNMMEHLAQAFQPDIMMRRDMDTRLPAAGIEFVAQDIQSSFVFEESGFRLSTFDVEHIPEVPSFGFRVEYEGRSVVLSGDARQSENLVTHAQGADLLIHEVVAPEARRAARSGRTTDFIVDQIVAHHTTPQQAGEVFSRVRPKLAVYSHIVGPFGDATINEINIGTAETYDGPFVIGHDLMSIEVGEEVRVVEA
ncbi:MAG: MBL fold metallo-hydrolase [Chloroflexi bacterium]|nr:MBL fold metallo-hydrolase [Chloroflexota bacterium]